MSAKVGEKAPGFTLPSDSWDNKISLENQTREGPVVLFFYPGDWSRVCGDQMVELQENLDRFEERGAKVLAISVDSPWSHRAYAKDRGLSFPLLSDFRREVAEEYGVLHERGFAERAYFVIDREGVIRTRRIEASPSDKPELDEVLEDLERAL